jgi:hypothetical protein
MAVMTAFGYPFSSHAARMCELPNGKYKTYLCDIVKFNIYRSRWYRSQLDYLYTRTLNHKEIFPI